MSNREEESDIVLNISLDLEDAPVLEPQVEANLSLDTTVTADEGECEKTEVQDRFLIQPAIGTDSVRSQQELLSFSLQLDAEVSNSVKSLL